MWVGHPCFNQKQVYSDWFKELSRRFNQNPDKVRVKQAKIIFVETYFENIQQGMNTKAALEHAKEVALHFLLVLL